MLFDVALHMGLETAGAVGLRCVLGMCHHRWHQALAWFTFALVTSVLTVLAVG